MRLLPVTPGSKRARGFLPRAAALAIWGLASLPCAAQSDVFELDPSQSMSITGKGPGQDAAINPYSGEKSLAVVENISDNSFEVRIQKQGEVLEIRPVAPGETEEFLLQKGYELYLDSELKARARVRFREYEE